MKKKAAKKKTAREVTQQQKAHTRARAHIHAQEQPRALREKGVSQWTQATVREEALIEEILLRLEERLKGADAAAGRRMAEWVYELRAEMKTAIGAVRAELDGPSSRTMAYRLARTLVDLLEEAENK